MQDYYLDSTQDFQNKYGSLAGATAAWYTWSMLGMGDKFLETGQWALPGLRKLGLQHDMLKTGDVVRRNGSAFGDAIGFKFRGATAAGMFSMGAARALGAVNIEATLTKPGWYVAQVVWTAMKAGPLAPAVLVRGAVFGAAWFGGGAMLGIAARSMKKNQYVDTVSYTHL